MKKIKNKFPKSIRKHIRMEKARIRKEILSPEEIREEINGLYKKIMRIEKQ